MKLKDLQYGILPVAGKWNSSFPETGNAYTWCFLRGKTWHCVCTCTFALPVPGSIQSCDQRLISMLYLNRWCSCWFGRSIRRYQMGQNRRYKHRHRGSVLAA